MKFEKKKIVQITREISHSAAPKSRMIPAENRVALAQWGGHNSSLVERAISLASDHQESSISSPENWLKIIRFKIKLNLLSKFQMLLTCFVDQ